jgi:MYXO-CTERM domain-containing protein
MSCYIMNSTEPLERTTKMFKPITLAALATLAPTAAYACGGFFCNNDPMDQAGEQIAFGVDSEAGTITMHTRIFYEGTAQEFAWVVPVPENPELFLSTDQLFTQLGWQTQPQFWMEYHFDDDCADGGYYYGPESSEDDSDGALADADTGAGGNSGVVVVSEQQVGAYDTVVLKATDTESLVVWLQDNDYNLPSNYATVLAPYVADGSHFVALKLQSGADSGDIAPLGLRYKGDKPTIPIQLTSIAATPDMRLEVYVFGDERAVPESYLHVQINEAAIDWFGNGSNYDDVITMAADEAGGHAFATDFSGSPSNWSGQLYWDGRYDTDALRDITNPVTYVDELMNQGFMGNATLLGIFQDHIDKPASVTVDDQSYYNCLSCYITGSEIDFDPEAMTDDMEEKIVQPLEEAESLYEHKQVSRMTSSVSPIEMTVDPTFVLNADMGDVANLHEADLTFACEEGQSYVDAVRILELEGGEQILFPPQQWFWDNNESESDYLDDLTEVNAVVIEKTGASGEPEVIFDYASQQQDDFNQNNEDVLDEFGEKRAGCGCNATPTASPLGLVGALGLLAIARRRQD